MALSLSYIASLYSGFCRNRGFRIVYYWLVDLNATVGLCDQTALLVAIEIGLAKSDVALILAGANFNLDLGYIT